MAVFVVFIHFNDAKHEWNNINNPTSIVCTAAMCWIEREKQWEREKEEREEKIPKWYIGYANKQSEWVRDSGAK